MTQLTIEQLQKRFVELMNLKHQFDAEMEQHKQRCIMIQGNLNEIQFQMQGLSQPSIPTPDETPPGDEDASKEREQQEDNSNEHQNGNCSGEEAGSGSGHCIQ